ncbi:hypothetical protein NPIL_411991 [Nephila pilipes]|uniref:Uncharacterized protein n=1 Tax=Nephila pilipes TaxID=299642 RepID=A0A8X6UFD0_NEPPI|nr:hypothetical protein NPIL_411991 [Nephila pilipes]
MDPTCRSQKRSKRVAYSAEEPEPTTSEKVSSWIQKNELEPVVNQPDPSGSDENPSSPKPRTPPYIFLFAEEDPSPEPTRDMSDLNVSHPSTSSGNISKLHVTGSSEELLLRLHH